MHASANGHVLPASDAPRLVCLTPTRNESWIIPRFLAAASTWADRIIVADQRSTDDTAAQIQRCAKAQLVHNDLPGYDENHRQQLLLRHARQVDGKRVLLGLDADEALNANCTQTEEWQRLRTAAPGTVLRFRWVNILPGFKEAWIPPEPTAFGFVDDGTHHTGKKIHSPRIPVPAGAPTIDFQDIVVLHFQYVAWDRMASKQRWYQAWELVSHGKKRPLDLYRQYNHMRSWSKEEIHPVRPEWFAGYDQAGIDFRALPNEPVTWWDREVVQMLCAHGPDHFRRLAIWDKDWNAVANAVGIRGVDLSDPRSPFEKLAHRLLPVTQNRRSNWSVRGFEQLLRVSGW